MGYKLGVTVHYYNKISKQSESEITTVHSSETVPLAFEGRIWAESRIKNAV